MGSAINDNFTCMSLTVPEDKKKALDKEVKAVGEKLEVAARFKSTVGKIEEVVAALTSFDQSLKSMDGWMLTATAELEDIRTASGSMLPEDRVARTMDLQEDIASKVEILKDNAATEKAILPQGDAIPADAQAWKDELARITKYVTDLAAAAKVECDKYSNDVKFWAEYRTGIKEFTPFLAGAEKAIGEGLSKPASLDEVKALNDKVLGFDKNCVNYLKVLTSAQAAAQKMTTHGEADAEVAGLKTRFDAVKAMSDTWVKKCDVLVKMESTLGELKNIFKEKEKLVEGL